MQCDARGGHVVGEEYYQRLSKSFFFKWKTSVHDRQELVRPLSVQSRILEFC